MTLRIEREMWQGPWNDDLHGPYYKIPCEQLHEFEAQVAERQWISVETELPCMTETGTSLVVLVTDGKHIGLAECATHNFKDKYWQSYSPGPDSYKITHWMPLPKIDAAEAQVAELKKDAERMEYLDKNMRVLRAGTDGTRLYIDLPQAMSFRLAIDAAKESGAHDRTGRED